MLERSWRGQAVDTNYSWLISSHSRDKERSQLVPKVLHSASGKSGTCSSVILCLKEKKSNRCWESCCGSSICSLPAPLTHANICAGILYIIVLQKSQDITEVACGALKYRLSPRLGGCGWISDFQGGDGAFVSGAGVKSRSRAADFSPWQRKEKIAKVS